MNKFQDSYKSTKNLYSKFEELVTSKSNELKTKFLFESLHRKDTPQLYDEWKKILSNNIDF